MKNSKAKPAARLPDDKFQELLQKTKDYLRTHKSATFAEIKAYLGLDYAVTERVLVRLVHENSIVALPEAGFSDQLGADEEAG